MTRRACLSGWLRAVQKYRGYISDADFRSVLREDADDAVNGPCEAHADSARVCVGLTCALAGSEEFSAALSKAGIIRDEAMTHETCAGQCWRAPVVIQDGRVYSGGRGALALDEEETFDLYCERGGYGVLKSCLAKRRNLDGIISSLSSTSLRFFERAESPLGIRIKELRSKSGGVKAVMLIDEDRPGDMAQSFFLTRFPHRVLDGLLILLFALGASDVVLYYTRRHEEECRKLHKKFLSLSDRGLAKNIQLTLIDAERQSEQRSLREICLSSNNADPCVSALIVDPEFLAWIPEIVARGDALHAEMPDGSLALYALVGCVSRPGIYKAPVFSTVHDLIGMAGGIRSGEVLHSFVPGDWSHMALPAHHSNLRVDAEVLAQADRMTFPIIFISESDDVRRQTAFPIDSIGDINGAASETQKDHPS